MDTKEIQKLLEFISKADLNEVKIETSELKLQVKRGNAESGKAAPVIYENVVATPQPQIPAAPAPAPETPVVTPAPEASSANTVEIKSPMIGTFYRSSSPDKPAFVEVGDTVTEGKVICILEAMKLFNEIESEISGKIVKVLVQDATPVEYDQPLFLVEID